MEGIREGNQIRGKHFRFTVLTERLLRLEYSEKGCFVDGESQMAVNRSFPPAEFHWEEGKQGEGILRTKYLRLIYKGEPSAVRIFGFLSAEMREIPPPFGITGIKSRA